MPSLCYLSYDSKPSTVGSNRMTATDRRPWSKSIEDSVIHLIRLFRVSRGGAVWHWMALAVIGGCRPTVPGGVDSLVF